MSDGMGCKCAARCEADCCCGADWTSAELAALRETVALMEGTLDSRDRNIADLIAVNKEAERKLKNACEHCGSTKIWSSGCPRCSAPVCCDSCCQIADTERRLHIAERKLAAARREGMEDALLAVQHLRNPYYRGTEAIKHAWEIGVIEATNAIRAKIGEQK